MLIFCIAKPTPQAFDQNESAAPIFASPSTPLSQPARCCQESASHFPLKPRSGAKLAPLKIPWQASTGHTGEKRQGHFRNHLATSWSASGPFTARDTTLRGPGRGLGGPVGSSWGFPLLLLKLRDTNLRGHENLSRTTSLIKLIVVMSSAVVFICFLDDHNCCPGI